MTGSDRNKPCPCGSGLRQKRCCGAKEPPPPTADDVLRFYRGIDRHMAVPAIECPCQPGEGGPEHCAGCCHLPIHVYDRDMELLDLGIAMLPDPMRATVVERAQDFMRRLRLTGADPDSPEGYGVIRTMGRAVVCTAFGVIWPPGGNPCPLLVPGTAPHTGSCAVYGFRPLDCRLHLARGPGAPPCDPTGTGAESLPVGPLRTGAERRLGLRPAGLLGIELWRALRVEVN